MTRGFDFARYEPYWRNAWDAGQAGHVATEAPRPFMVIPMFPYPSGKLHVGHVRNYTISDVQARYWRRRGYDVMHPIGWDAFGLPAENAAVKSGIHPEVYTRLNIADMTVQLKEIGLVYDWGREVAACDPDYYKWTQWLFVQLFKHGLAYKARAPVNWCPACQTALANEQVVDGPAPTQAAPGEPTGKCERCGTPMIARDLEQWFFKITAFADDLLDGLSRLPDWSDAVKTQQRHWIGKHADGTLHLRDWLVSRQRYWGAPIPIIECPHCGTVPVPEDQLPVLLPKGVDFTPKGEPPLATVAEFMGATCPHCGAAARRSPETMDTFVDSSWYLYRYVSARDADRPFDPAAVARWLPVDVYVGGAEHAILHLMYVRFICKALQRMGYLTFDEPVTKLFNLGMVYRNGAKMSKSKGNAVTQDQVVARYGADTLRLWAMFMAPLSQHVEWNTTGIEGCHRFLRRVFTLADGNRGVSASGQREQHRHRTIKAVTEGIESFHYNTAISALMSFVNTVEASPWPEGVATVVHLMSPFAPFAAEEIWHRWGRKGSIHTAAWPQYDPAVAAEQTLAVPVQVAGKVRGTVTLSATATRAEAEEAVAASAGLAPAVAGHSLRAYVPGRMISYE